MYCHLPSARWDRSGTQRRLDAVIDFDLLEKVVSVIDIELPEFVGRYCHPAAVSKGHIGFTPLQIGTGFSKRKGGAAELTGANEAIDARALQPNRLDAESAVRLEKRDGPKIDPNQRPLDDFNLELSKRALGAANAKIGDR